MLNGDFSVNQGAVRTAADPEPLLGRDDSILVPAPTAPTNAAESPAAQSMNRHPSELSQAQRSAPYAEALQRFADRDTVGLMVPGHGLDVHSGAEHLGRVFGDRVVALDVPLMLEGIDMGENSPLTEAQRLAADAWGAQRTWFMTNGASQANRTAALAVRGLGERVLMQRSAHSSFSDGVLLAGLIPAFVLPNVDEVHGISHGLTPAKLFAALEGERAAGRPVSSVYVVSPSYFGSTADVRGLAEVAHQFDAALIVDGAWGAHFGFHKDLPESPARLGADLVVSSTHKLAGSFTQSAMLHLGAGPFAERLEPLVSRAVMMTASTSASAVLMGSLDLARQALMAGHAQIERALGTASELRTGLRAHDLYAVISDEFDRYEDIVQTDPLRIPIDVSRLGQSGHWVRERLIEDHAVYFEMSTATSIVAVIGALAAPDTSRIMRALEAVAHDAMQRMPSAHASLPLEFPTLPAPGTLRMLPRDAYFGESEVVAVTDAVGRVSADTLAAYPPGIPNLIPGEEITATTLAFLRAVAASPTGYVRGAADGHVDTVRVVRN